MSPSQSVAASLPPNARQKMAIEMLAKSKPVSYLAAEHQVSRKFLYEQSQKAKMQFFLGIKTNVLEDILCQEIKFLHLLLF